MTQRNDKNTNKNSISQQTAKIDARTQSSTLELWQQHLRTLAKQKNNTEDAKTNAIIVAEQKALLHTVESSKNEYSEHSFSVSISVMSHNSELDWATE